MDPNQQPVPQSDYVPVPPQPYVRPVADQQPQQQQYAQQPPTPQYAPQPAVQPVVSQSYAPQPAMTPPVPQQAYAATPVAPPVPSQPFGPQLAQAPQQQPAPAPVFGSGPQPGFVATDNVPTPYSPKKSPKKLIIIIAAVVAGIVALSAGGWLVYILISTNLPLKEYSGDSYTLLVPEAYKQSGDSTYATFTEPDAPEESQSQIQVGASELLAEDKQLYIDSIDKSFTDEAIAKSLAAEAGKDSKLSNVKTEKTTQGGNPTRVVTADIEDKGKKIGIFRYVISFGDKMLYTVMVVAHESDPGLVANATKITDSLKIK